MQVQLIDLLEFKINEIVLVTKGGNIDLSGLYAELSLYDSLFSPVCSGSMMIRDAIGLSSKIAFDGSESILIDITKNDDSEAAGLNYKKAFRVYKQSNRKNTGVNSEIYTLHFVSEELLLSQQTSVNQSYTSTYTDVVHKIMVNYLTIPDSELTGYFEPSVGIRKIVIPNLAPIEAIRWCAKRAVDIKQSPNFVFFQNSVGFNFTTLSKLLTSPEILDITFDVKNTQDAVQEVSGARAMEIISQVNEAENIVRGINASRFIGFDPISKMIAQKNIPFQEMFNAIEHGNETPNITDITNRFGESNLEQFAGKEGLNFFSTAKQFSSYIKDFDPESLSLEDNVENYIMQRAMLMGHLMSKRVKVVMPGNFQLSSGFVVNLDVKNFAQKNTNEDFEDASLSGRYLITAARHIIGYEKHETVLELATTTTKRNFVNKSQPQQLEAISGNYNI